MPEWEGRPLRFWRYPAATFTVFPDSTAVLASLDLTVLGASVETPDGALDAGTPLADLARRYPRSWECRAVLLDHGHYMAGDPPQESLVVFDTTATAGRQTEFWGARFVGGGDGRLAAVYLGM